MSDEMWLAFTVVEINTWRFPFSVATSPAPPTAQGMKTEIVTGKLMFVSTAALVGKPDNKNSSTTRLIESSFISFVSLHFADPRWVPLRRLRCLQQMAPFRFVRILQCFIHRIAETGSARL